MSARSLPNFIHDRYGIKVQSVMRPGRGLINDNFILTTPKGRFLFKSYRLRSRRQAEFELSLLERLGRLSFPSPQPIRDLDGSLVVAWNRRPGALLRYIEGSILTRAKARDLKNIGTLLGRMHRFLRPVLQPVPRERFDPPEIARLIRARADSVASRPFRQASSLAQTVKREFFSLSFPKGLPTGITHQDVKQENIVRTPKGTFSFIDFDNAYRGTLLYDTLTPVIWLCFKRGKLDLGKLRAYLSGYERERRLTRAERKHFLDALRFRLLREAFVWPLRWLDPRMAPHYGLRFLRAYRLLGKEEDAVKRIVQSGYY